MNYDIHQALEDIRAWVNEIEAENLSETCRTCNIDFFEFLERKGHDSEVFIRAIFEVTGHEPHNLYTVEDARQLRCYIEGYEVTTFELSHEEYRYGQTDDEWLENSTRRNFSE